MANFNTHFTVATFASGLASSSLLTTGLFTPKEALILWLAGTFGGMLPDIDADDSKAIRVIFNLFGGFTALLCIVYFHHKIAVVSLWILVTAVYIGIRYVLMTVFEFFTIHRGNLHSILAVVLFGMITVCLMNLLGSHHLMAWSAGIFVSAGTLVHLALDELYSVDISNVRIKRSFGSALKLTDFSNPTIGILQLACIAVLIYFSPPLNELIESIAQWQSLHSQQFHFLPYWLK